MPYSALHYVWLLFVCITLFNACQKDHLNTNRLEIVSEDISNKNSKMYVNDKATYWEEGDKIIINGNSVSICKDGSGKFYADLDSYDPETNYWGTTTGSGYNYPQAGGKMTFNLPHTYRYSAVSVNGQTYQKIAAPMLGYKTPSDDKLLLKHLTGALLINVSNHADGSKPIVIDRITVSNDQGYKLCGSLTVTYTSANSSSFVVSPQTGADETESSVIMDIGNGLSIDYDDAKTIQIPIRTAGTDFTPVKFKIKVTGYISGTRYTFEQEQTTGGILGRAVAGYASVDINPSNGHTSTGPLFSSIVGGDGKTYYQIYTPSDWRLMSGSDNYILMDDIDMTGVNTYTKSYFSGILLGNFHTVSNLTVISSNSSEPAYMNCGLFELASNATISSLTINGMTLKRRNGSTSQVPFGGAIASFTSTYQPLTISGVTITNLNFDFGDSILNAPFLGGFIGDIQGDNITIENSSISFAPNVIINCSGEALIGGIASGRYSTYGYDPCTPVVNNVSINFNNLSVNQSGSNVVYFGGLLGRKGSANVTPTTSSVSGTVQINSSGKVYKGKVYGDSSEIPTGINTSGLVWD